MLGERSLMDMLSCLEEELGCYQSLYQLALEQKRVLESQNLERLDSILEEKDHWIKEIKRIEERLAPVKAEWLKYDRDGDLCPKVEGLVGEVKSLLEELLPIEEETQRLLSERQIIVKTHLRNLQKGWLMLRYAPKRTRRPRFMDVRR